MSPADPYMQLAVYDLVGALFAPSDPFSRHTDKLFARICGIIKDRFADPDFGPCEVAAEAGISLRYLQKLFTARGSTCSEFITFRFVWITPRAFYIAGRRWTQASLSARSPTPAALATILISHENSATGSVMPLAAIRKNLIALTIA